MSPAWSSSPAPVDRLRPERARASRARRRMGLRARRRGQRLLDRTGGAACRAPRSRSARTRTRLTPLLLQHFGIEARAGSDSRGLSRHSAAGGDRSARAVRSHRVQGRGFGGDRDSPWLSRRAGVVGALGRSEAGPGGRAVSVRPRGRHVPAVPWLYDELDRRLPLACALSRTTPFARRAGGRRGATCSGGRRGAAPIPEYEQIDCDQTVAGDVSREDVRGRSDVGKGARRERGRGAAQQPSTRHRPAHRTNPDTVVSRSGCAARPGPGRLLTGDNLQPRRIHRIAVVASGQLPDLHGATSVLPCQPPGRSDQFSQRSGAGASTPSASATRQQSPRQAESICRLLGIGTNGHIGFNEPASALVAHTHNVVLKAETRRSNAALFGGDVERVPREALSMGMATILHARRDHPASRRGSRRRRASSGLVTGPITTEVPASFLELHDASSSWLDEAAASSAPSG